MHLCKLRNVFVFSFSSQTRCDFHPERSTEYVSQKTMYIPRIKLTCAHQTALCIDSSTGCINIFSSHHLRLPCKSLRKKNVSCSRLFGVTGNCAACSKLIPAFEMVMRAKDNVYHLDCFACQLCNQR